MKTSSYSFLFFMLFLCLNLSESLAQQSRDSLNYYINLLERPQKEKDLITALHFFEKGAPIAEVAKGTLLDVYYLIYLAQVQFELGYITESESASVRALRILEDFKSDSITKKYIITLQNNLGKVYRKLKNYKEAKKCYEMILQLTDSNNISNLSVVNNNLGNVYRDLKNYEEAIRKLSIARKLAWESEDDKLISRSLDNLGITLAESGKDEGIGYMYEALKLRQENDDPIGLFSSQKHLSEYYFSINNVDSAKFYAGLNLDLSRILDSPSYIREALDMIIRLKDDPFMNEFLDLNDSIEGGRLSLEKRLSLRRFNFEKAKESSEKRKRIIYVLISIGGLILLLSIFLYFLLKSRHKKEKLQEIFRVENQISKKVHDEVANDVYHIMNKLQEDAVVHENVIDELEQVYSKTRDIAKEHGVLEIQGDFREALQDILLSYTNETTNVITRGLDDINWESISELKRTTLYKVLQELMINMKKHSEATVTLVSFRQSRNMITIDYSDNGVGAILKKSNGLRNVETRIKSIGGTIIFDSQIDKGFKVKMTV